jgi:cyclophilin family peptidyl-prolyl cis-trans isomerase
MVNVLLLALAFQYQSFNTYNPSGPKIEVTMAKGGSFVIATDKVSSPITVAHILGLVKNGFYDGQRVHRVEHWVTQWGAPASRDKPLGSDEVGDGGSGKDIMFEESPVYYTRGVVGIAARGKKKGGDSQLFILKKDAPRLIGNYAVVGLVVKGMDVVDRIQYGDRITSIKVVSRGNG